MVKRESRKSIIISVFARTRLAWNLFSYFQLSGTAQRFALLALGRAAERRPTGKMLRRRKMPGIAPESPASGARFVGQPACLPECRLKKNTTAYMTYFETNYFIFAFNLAMLFSNLGIRWVFEKCGSNLWNSFKIEIYRSQAKIAFSYSRCFV